MLCGWCWRRCVATPWATASTASLLQQKFSSWTACGRLRPSDSRMAAIFSLPTSGWSSVITSQRLPDLARWWGRCWRRSSVIFRGRCGCWPERYLRAACRTS